VETFLQEISRSRTKTKAKPLEAVIPMIQECVREIRRIQTNLRPSILDDLGVIVTLSWLCREFESTYPGIRIEKQITVREEEVPDPLRMVVYRILQEGLNNISKHSGASQVHFSFGKADRKIELSVRDNGRGFDPLEVFSREIPMHGLGLASMKERTEHEGGIFVIESTPGKGTTLKATWPL
jgi:signal transduction histidine kinase